MNTRTRSMITGGVSAAVAAATLTLGAAPAAQAQTSSPTALLAVNCSTGAIHSDGNQEYFSIACSSVDGTKWWVNVRCSDGFTRSQGPNTTFQDVRVYCPAGTTAQQGWVTTGS